RDCIEGSLASRLWCNPIGIHLCDKANASDRVFVACLNVLPGVSVPIGPGVGLLGPNALHHHRQTHIDALVEREPPLEPRLPAHDRRLPVIGTALGGLPSTMLSSKLAHASIALRTSSAYLCF